MAELLDIGWKTLDEKHAEDIVVIDMRTSNPYSDYYVVCTSRNQRHGASLAEFCEQEAEKKGYAVRVREGDRDSNWILLDLGEVVVHIFTEDARSFYRLERLWADMPQQNYSGSETL